MPLISENQKGSVLVEELFSELTLSLADYMTLVLNGVGSYLNAILKAIYTPIVPSSAVVSVGVSLTSLFFCLEMFSQLAQFRVERIEDAIRIAMKFIVAKVIIENTDGISQGIYQIFRISAVGGVRNACQSIANAFSPSDSIQTGAGGLLGIGYLLLFCTTGIAVIFIIITIFKMAISFIGMSFEIGIHQALAPIALSTLCNDLARPTGIAFIKSYASVCLQLTVITAIFDVFGKVLNTLISLDLNKTIGVNNPTVSAGLGIFSFVLQFISPLICVIALSKAINISSDLTKRMFGA